MRLNKLFLALAATTVIASGALAQPTATLSIHLRGIGTALSDFPDGLGQDVSSLTPVPSSAPQTITLDISDFGSSDFYYVQVTTRLRYANHDPNVTRGIGIVNSYINLANTGLTIYTGWINDETGFPYSDARKNVNSHIGGSPITDCADNQDLRDNSAQAWNPNANGGPLAGVPAAVGKSTYGTPVTGAAFTPLYSFVIVVPKQVGVYQVAFDRVLSGGSANTDLTVKTNVLGNTPQGQPYQFDLNTLNGTIEVVPEPASMIALGSGLVGLLALRRRRSN